MIMNVDIGMGIDKYTGMGIGMGTGPYGYRRDFVGICIDMRMGIRMGMGMGMAYRHPFEPSSMRAPIAVGTCPSHVCPHVCTHIDTHQSVCNQNGWNTSRCKRMPLRMLIRMSVLEPTCISIRLPYWHACTNIYPHVCPSPCLRTCPCTWPHARP